MSGDVAVVDPLPMFRHGVAALLTAAGYHVETPDDLVHWAGHQNGSLVLITLTSPADWLVLADLVAVHPDCVVVALVGDVSVEACTRAVRGGARSVVPRDVSAEALRRTVAATADGQAVLPAVVAGALAASTATLPAGSAALPPEQISWLRDLAAGHTVAQLASRVGYSERAMFRMLRSLYRKMGVHTRTEAIVRAGELGWLKTGPAAGHARG